MDDYECVCERCGVGFAESWRCDSCGDEVCAQHRATDDHCQHCADQWADYFAMLDELEAKRVARQEAVA